MKVYKKMKWNFLYSYLEFGRIYFYIDVKEMIINENDWFIDNFYVFWVVYWKDWKDWKDFYKKRIKNKMKYN